MCIMLHIGTTNKIKPEGAPMTRHVRIYCPAKNAMQSGMANTKRWVVEYEPTAPKTNDMLMGWVGSRDTGNSVRMRFDSKEAAIAYAKREGFTYDLHEPHRRQAKPKSYADNFAFNKVKP
jgi:hypothetical protein